MCAGWRQVTTDPDSQAEKADSRYVKLKKVGWRHFTAQ